MHIIIYTCTHTYRERLSLYMCTFAWVWILGCQSVGQKLTLGVVPQVPSSFLFLRQHPSLVWGSLVRRGWLGQQALEIDLSQS